ncbi:MAG: hypothetical protein ABI134_28830 [Byssovorax sp.]
MKKLTICHAWSGLLTLAVATWMTALPACADQGTSAEECGPFLTPTATKLPIHIVNHRTTDVVLQTYCDVGLFFDLGDGKRHPAQKSPIKRSCDGDNYHCMMYGASYGGISIPAGETVEVEAEDLFYVDVALPAACIPAGALSSCEQALVLPSGPVTLIAKLRESDKEPDDSFEVTASFVHGTDKSVEIVIE